MFDGSGNPHGGTDFASMPQGAGGYNICGGQSADGDVFATGVDVYGVWIKNSASVVFQLLTSEAGIPVEADRSPTVTGDKIGDLQFSGCKGLYFSPSNVNRMVFWWRSAVYVCDNAKAARPTAALTTLQDKKLPTNEINNRGYNDIIAIHPTDDDIWIAGTFNDGVYYTTDGGVTWHAVSIGANGTGFNGYNMFYLVAFDPTNGNNVYIVRQGTGVYKSTTGVSGTFSLMSGSPLYAFSMTVDVTGKVWVCDPSATGTTPALHKCVSGTWSAVTQAGGTAVSTSKCVAVNPLNSLEIVTSEDWVNNYQHSTDGGTTWTIYAYGDSVPHTGLVGTAEYQWMVDGPVLASRLWFDPIVDGKVWASHGGGLAWSIPPVSSPWQWNDVSRGMECQVANNTLSVPGLPPLFFSWDTAIWRGVPSLDSFAKIPQNTVGQTYISNAWAGDYAADDPNYIVVAGSQTASGDLAGYSEDGGVAFQSLFPNGFPEGGGGGHGGTIAVNRRPNQMLAPGNNLNAIYTKNEWGRYTGTLIQGVDWDYLNPMAPGTPLGYWANNLYVRIDTIAADKTRAGVFALRLGYYQSPGQGLWVTTDGGDSFTQTVVGATDPTGDPLDFGTARMEYIPGKSGEFVLGDAGNSSHLLYYTNDGLSGPTELGNITRVYYWRFGGTFPGKSYPCIYFYGSVVGDANLGLYRMDDIFSDPVLLTYHPFGSFDGVSTVGADVNDPTLVYFGFQGSGFGYGKIRDWATAT